MPKVSAEERYWSKVDRRGPEACWLWTAGTYRDGYGCFRTARRTQAAHRVSYELAYGAIPPGLLVCHRCDVRLCVNPAHLFPGSHQDNMTDMVRKGRGMRGDGHYLRLAPEKVQGELNRNTGLVDREVREIRRLVADGSTQAAVAARYGLDPSTVSYIVSRKTWRHLI